MEEKSSIFDEASRGGRASAKPKHKAKNIKQDTPSNPFGFEKKEGVVNLDEFNPATMTLADLNNMIATVRSLQDEIDQKLDALYQQSGWTSKSIQDYLDNPNNFTSDHWKIIQKQRKQLLNSLKTEKELSIESASPQSDAPEKDPQKANKERRGKMIGARRNWISMR